MTDTFVPEVARRLDAAVRFALQAGEVTLRHFRNLALVVERKGDGSPVTLADREAEQTLRKLIAAEFPTDAIVGEEYGVSAGDSGYTWVLDPIDGTKSFIHGVPLYTTLIGVLHGESTESGTPQLGVIHAPATGETVYATTGGKAWSLGPGSSEPRPARVSSQDSLGKSLVLTSEVASFGLHAGGDALPRYLELQAQARLCRTWGDGYGYLMVATGRAEVMLDPVMNLWDAAALAPVIEGAGGRFTDWRGVATVHSGDSIATNGVLHPAALAALGLE